MPQYDEFGYPLAPPRNFRPVAQVQITPGANPRANIVRPVTHTPEGDPLSKHSLDELKNQFVNQLWGENIEITQQNYNQFQTAIDLQFPGTPQTVDVWIGLSDPTNPTNVQFRSSFGSRNGRYTCNLAQGSHTIGGNRVKIDIIANEFIIAPAGGTILATVFAKPGCGGWAWTEDV